MRYAQHVCCQFEQTGRSRSARRIERKIDGHRLPDPRGHPRTSRRARSRGAARASIRKLDDAGRSPARRSARRRSTKPSWRCSRTSSSRAGRSCTWPAASTREACARAIASWRSTRAVIDFTPAMADVWAVDGPVRQPRRREQLRRADRLRRPVDPACPTRSTRTCTSAPTRRCWPTPAPRCSIDDEKDAKKNAAKAPAGAGVAALRADQAHRDGGRRAKSSASPTPPTRSRHRDRDERKSPMTD